MHICMLVKHTFRKLVKCLIHFFLPIHNTWIELMYNQNQKDIMIYAKNIFGNDLLTGVLMIDDNRQEDYGKWDFHQGLFSDPKLMIDS